MEDTQRLKNRIHAISADPACGEIRDAPLANRRRTLAMSTRSSARERQLPDRLDVGFHQRQHDVDLNHQVDVDVEAAIGNVRGDGPR
jgi:hypothetical protein